MDTPRFLPIEDNEKLIRDTVSGAVLNTDMTSLQKYRAKRERDMQLQQDVETLKNQMSNIESLLQQLVNRDKT